MVGRCGRRACKSAPISLPRRPPGGVRASPAAIAMGETSPCARGFEILGEVSIWDGAGRTAKRELKMMAWLVRGEGKAERIGLGPNFYRVQYGRPTCKEETPEILSMPVRFNQLFSKRMYQYLLMMEQGLTIYSVPCPVPIICQCQS